MKIGTRSVLFGVHQFLWHPLTVVLAWRKLYGCWPRREELVAIAMHDVGYWGCPNIDGPEGRLHPERGARWTSRVARWFGWDGDWGCVLALFHSREYAKRHGGGQVSTLCWPDKYSVTFEPKWFFLLRANLSGEIAEFKANAVRAGHLPAGVTDSQWFDWYVARVNQQVVIRNLLFIRELRLQNAL